MRYRHTMWLICISLPICVVLRLVQMAFMVENTTGFIRQQYSFTSTLITTVILAAVATVAALSTAADGIKQKNISLQPGVAVSSILVGGMFIYQMVANVSLLRTGFWYNIIFVALSFLSAFVFIMYGIKNVYEYKMPTLEMVIPVAYYVVRLINIFINTSKLALVTENIFLILTNSAVLLFMYELAALENEIGNPDKKPKKLFAFGITAIMLCVTTSLSKLIMILFTSVKYPHADIAGALLNLSIAVFILIYIMCNFGERTKARSKNTPKHLA